MSQITSTSSAASTANSSIASGTAALSANSNLANEDTFLKLLVAQLQNQDPLQPQDGTQFVSQLAQFSDLEQNLAMRSDLDAIKSQYTATSGATTNTGGTRAA